MSKKKIGIVSLGCPKNLVDSEIMLGRLKEEDYEIINNEQEAEIIIVNTCGFIESAKQESINTILEMADLKDRNCKLLIVSGCLAERYKEQIMEQIPEVDAVVGTGNYGEILDVVREAAEGKKPLLYGKLDGLEYIENERILSTKSGMAYLKIAEGCDNCCTYCIIPSLRGRYRSREMGRIVEEARKLAKQGVKELVLVAQDTTRYGMDQYGERKLPELIRRLSAVEGIEWIRLLYCYPEELDDRLIDEIATNGKVCKYLDIPIQHISDDVLKAMGRRGNSEDIKALLQRIRQRIPGIILRTSFIVGFPGEHEEDFEKLFTFVREFEIDRVGVFAYSREEDTKAATFECQIDERTKQERVERIMVLQQEVLEKKNKRRIDKIYKVLVEGVADDGIFYFGRTYGEAPDIDGIVYFTSSEPLQLGHFADIKIITVDHYDLIGEVVHESTK